MIASARESGPSEFVSEGDRLIHAAVLKALSSSNYTALRKLTCRVSAGELELHGTVPSFYLKQLAQSTLQNLGFLEVRDRIEVRG